MARWRTSRRRRSQTESALSPSQKRTRPRPVGESGSSRSPRARGRTSFVRQPPGRSRPRRRRPCRSRHDPRARPGGSYLLSARRSSSLPYHVPQPVPQPPPMRPAPVPMPAVPSFVPTPVGRNASARVSVERPARLPTESRRRHSPRHRDRSCRQADSVGAAAGVQVKVRAEPPSGFTPRRSRTRACSPSTFHPTGSARSVSDAASSPVDDEPRAFPWKLAAIAVGVAIIAIFVGRSYLPGRAAVSGEPGAQVDTPTTTAPARDAATSRDR